ncbi:peptidase inhibitor family I36 protein [Kutzneria sp. NPDC052558]|uniref:peptidase inhibitor family I36 protein n=1 Tax=Kutzneria sp. NPDC052558 TaxID=3364121 RepID=UPI0037C53A9A
MPIINVRRGAWSALLAAALLAVGFTGAQAADASSFTEQASMAGLSTAQAGELQRQVDAYVAQTGGRQISANKIDLGGGALVVALPGETYARDVAAPLAPPPCYAGDLCLYSGQNYTGSYLYFYKCQTVFVPWYTTGSFNDNQTSGTISTFERISPPGHLRYVAKVKVPSINWANIGNITVC